MITQLFVKGMGFRTENIAAHDHCTHFVLDGPALDLGNQGLSYPFAPRRVVDDKPHDLDSFAGNKKVALFGGNPAKKGWLFPGGGHSNEMIWPIEQ